MSTRTDRHPYQTLLRFEHFPPPKPGAHPKQNGSSPTAQRRLVRWAQALGPAALACGGTAGFGGLGKGAAAIGEAGEPAQGIALRLWMGEGISWSRFWGLENRWLLPAFGRFMFGTVIFKATENGCFPSETKKKHAE